jgi:hypothetical protein
MLGVRLPPTVRVVAEIDTVATGRVRVARGANCGFYVSRVLFGKKIIHGLPPRRRRVFVDVSEAEYCIRERNSCKRTPKNRWC